MGCFRTLLLFSGGCFVSYLLLYLFLFNGRVVFYGRVVNEHGSPVEGVEVGYHIRRETWLPIPFVDLPFMVSRGTKRTDQDGRFSLRWQRGRSLSINTAVAPGYRDAVRPRLFTFENLSEKDHHADPANPEIFLVVTSGHPRAEDTHKSLRFRWNDGVQEIPLKGIGPLRLEPTRQMKPGQFNGFPWELTLSMAGAELAPAESRNPLAAESGYLPEIRMSPRDKEQMRNVGAVWYDFRTSAGRYGRLQIGLYPERADMRVNGSLDVYLCPEGARNLDHN